MSKEIEMQGIWWSEFSNGRQVDVTIELDAHENVSVIEISGVGRLTVSDFQKKIMEAALYTPSYSEQRENK